MAPKKCKYCSGKLFRRIGTIKQTTMYLCLKCWAENVEYKKKQICQHEYTKKSKNKCIHCGKSK